MTRRRSNNQRSGGIADQPVQKKIRVQKSAGNVLVSPRFWGDQEGILLIDYLLKGQTINAEYYSPLRVQLKAILKGKRRGKFTKNVCSCTTMPQLTGHLQPRRNWPTWASSILITHPERVGLSPVPWTEKKNN
jgi:hypothetical protein